MHFLFLAICTKSALPPARAKKHNEIQHIASTHLLHNIYMYNT
jgi:hypothetical protein